MNSINFGSDVKLKKFEILGPSVLRLVSLNVLVFALLTAKSFFLLAECKPFLKYVCMKFGFKDFKVLKNFSNLHKRHTSIAGGFAFNSKLL